MFAVSKWLLGRLLASSRASVEGLEEFRGNLSELFGWLADEGVDRLAVVTRVSVVVTAVIL